MNFWFFPNYDPQLQQIQASLQTLIRKVDKMAIDQATFDQDLAALVQAVTDENTAVANLAAALDAFIAANPTVDLTAEDANVQGALATAAAASQTLADELAKITPAA